MNKKDEGTKSIERFVLCKDCTHMEKMLNGHRYCHVWRDINGMGDSGYCNYGERKEGAENG